MVRYRQNRTPQYPTRSAHIALPALMLAALVAAGCISGTQGGDEVAAPGSIVKVGGKSFVTGVSGTLFDPEWAEHAVPFGDDHDHADPHQHANLSTPNFEVLGYDPLHTDWYGKTAGGYGCGDAVSNGERVLSVTSSFTTEVALIITDVTDPTNPQKLGELVMPSTHIYDNAITPDQRHVLLATSPFEDGPTDPTRPPLSTAMQPFFRDACTGQERLVDGPEAGLPYAAGLILLDITNPRAPAIVDFRMFPPIGIHSIRAFEVDGSTLLVGSVFGLSGAGGYYMLMDIIDTPDGGKLNVISFVYPPSHYEDPERAQTWSTHDAYIQEHPATGQLLLYLADVYHGVWIADIADPRLPEFIGHWDAKSSFGRDVLVHGVDPTPDLWDGRHYTFVGEECFGHYGDTPTCVVVTLDTTDPTDPKTISAWTVPTDLHWEQELMFSLHYGGLMNKTLLVSNYHGGIWAIDVSTPEARRTMPTVGVFIPDKVPPDGVAPPANSIEYSEYHAFTPIVWDFDVLADGTVIVYDKNSGLYAVRFHADDPAPPPTPWPMDHVKFDAQPG